MGKRRKIEEINGETQLPREIIHHIQSFLDGKEAARTTILSKSWYEAWLTRPNLDFSEADLPATTPFMDFGNKTIQRYEKANLKIQSFKLLIDGKSKDYLSDRISLAEDWTRKALKLGATDIDIQISYKNPNGHFNFVLPQEVLESEMLVNLSLAGSCKIDLKGKKVNCSGLKSLRLRKLGIAGNYNIWDIISKICPLTEEFALSKCSMVLISGLSMDSFRKLKVLSFKNVKFDKGFFDNFSSKFPNLKNLGLNKCAGCEQIQISSNSLELISFTYSKIDVLELDVPRIKKFEFSSRSLPSISFKTTSTEWESNIFIGKISCFVELRKFLQELSPSKINLDLSLSLLADEEYDRVEDLIGLPKPPIVEELTLSTITQSLFYSAVWENLFWSCRPNVLVLYFEPSFTRLDPSDFTKFLLVEEANRNRNLFDLKEVNIDYFQLIDRMHNRWLPLSCEAPLLEYSWIKACLQLTWGDGI